MLEDTKVEAVQEYLPRVNHTRRMASPLFFALVCP